MIAASTARSSARRRPPPGLVGIGGLTARNNSHNPSGTSPSTKPIEYSPLRRRRTHRIVNGLPRRPETRKVVPHLLDRLRGMVASTRCIPDDARIEYAVDGYLCAQVDVLLSAVAGMTEEFFDLESEAGVPLHGAAQAQGRNLDDSTSITGVQDQRLRVAVRSHRPVNLRLDVVVEVVLTIGEGKLDEPHAGRDTKIRGFKETVRVAERGPRQRLGCQPEVGRAEPWCPAHGLATEVQRPMDGPLMSGRFILGPVEDPALPAPPVAAGICGQSAVAGSRDEL